MTFLARVFGGGVHRPPPTPSMPAITMAADRGEQLQPAPNELTDDGRDDADMRDPAAKVIRLRERERCSAIMQSHLRGPLFAAAKHLAFATDMRPAAAADVLVALAPAIPPAAPEEPAPLGYLTRRYGAGLIEEKE